jgi:hypothetical protein
MYANWLSCGEQIKLDTTPLKQRPEKVAELRAGLESVKDWLHSGCPCERTIVVVDEHVPHDDVQQVSFGSRDLANELPASPDAPLARSESHYPPCFHDVDLDAINDSRQCVQFCVFLARHGFPCPDKFLEVVSTLAKWFAFVELHHLWPDRTHIKLLLKDFALISTTSSLSGLIMGWLMR